MDPMQHFTNPLLKAQQIRPSGLSGDAGLFQNALGSRYSQNATSLLSHINNRRIQAKPNLGAADKQLMQSLNPTVQPMPGGGTFAPGALPAVKQNEATKTAEPYRFTDDEKININGFNRGISDVLGGTTGGFVGAVAGGVGGDALYDKFRRPVRAALGSLGLAGKGNVASTLRTAKEHRNSGYLLSHIQSRLMRKDKSLPEAAMIFPQHWFKTDSNILDPSKIKIPPVGPLSSSTAVGPYLGQPAESFGDKFKSLLHQLGTNKRKLHKWDKRIGYDVYSNWRNAARAARPGKAIAAIAGGLLGAVGGTYAGLKGVDATYSPPFPEVTKMSKEGMQMTEREAVKDAGIAGSIGKALTQAGRYIKPGGGIDGLLGRLRTTGTYGAAAGAGTGLGAGLVGQAALAQGLQFGASPITPAVTAALAAGGGMLGGAGGVAGQVALDAARGIGSTAMRRLGVGLRRADKPVAALGVKKSELTEREVFKAAFLSHCADQGMDMVETATAVKEAQTKLSALSDLITTPVNTMWDGVKSMGGLAKNVGIIGALGLPLAAGAGIGYGAAALTDVNDEDVEETKLKELIDEHRRLAQRARMNAAASQAKQQNTRRGRPLI